LDDLKAVQASREELTLHVANLRDDLKLWVEKATDALQKLSAARVQLDNETRQNQALAEELAKTRNSISPALLGLRGKLQNVAILLDRSGSMDTPLPDKSGSRWSGAVDTVSNWLSYLKVQRCVLITFGDTVDAYPSQGLLLVDG